MRMLNTMSMLDDLLKTVKIPVDHRAPDEKDIDFTKKIEEPPKKWQNWWKALPATRKGRPVDYNEKDVSVGNKIPDKYIHPSKEIAEQKAVHMFQQQYKVYGCNVWEHAGAFPIKE